MLYDAAIAWELESVASESVEREWMSELDRMNAKRYRFSLLV